MKRDMDLVRSILLAVEESGPPRGVVNLSITGYSPELVSHHVWLMKEAGLVTAVDFSTHANMVVKPKALTWAGHEFLDAARNDGVWNSVKERVGQHLLTVPFEVLKGMLVQAAASMFGS